MAFLCNKSATFIRNIYQVNSNQYFCCSCKHLHCCRSISIRSTQTSAVFTLILLLFLSMLMLLQISNLRKGRLHHIHPAGRFVGWLVSVTIDFRFMRFALLTLSSSCPLLMISKCTIAPENNLLGHWRYLIILLFLWMLIVDRLLLMSKSIGAPANGLQGLGRLVGGGRKV